MQKRGMLTERIKEKSKELLGYEISQKELRLMPYIIHVMMNEQKLDPEKIDQEERKIMADWREKQWVEGGASGLNVSHYFWTSICEIVMLGYVDID